MDQYWSPTMCILIALVDTIHEEHQVQWHTPLACASHIYTPVPYTKHAINTRRSHKTAAMRQHHTEGSDIKKRHHELESRKHVRNAHRASV
eukprot:5084334-Pyramimonas_sp.AAC.1